MECRRLPDMSFAFAQKIFSYRKLDSLAYPQQPSVLQMTMTSWILAFSRYSLTKHNWSKQNNNWPKRNEPEPKLSLNVSRKFEKERQKYKEQHPEKAKDDEDETAKYYEDAQMRELRMIYEAQANIYKVMQQMETKLQEIAQQQHVHTSMLQGGAGAGQQQPGQQQQVAAGGAFLVHEKNELIQGVREISTALRDMKNYVTEIYTRSYNIEQKIQHGTGTGTVTNQNQQDPAVRNYLEQIQQEVRQIRSNQIAQTPGSQQAAQQGMCAQNCVTNTIFIVIIAIQSVALLAFIFIRSKSDKAKFY